MNMIICIFFKDAIMENVTTTNPEQTVTIHFKITRLNTRPLMQKKAQSSMKSWMMPFKPFLTYEHSKRFKSKPQKSPQHAHQSPAKHLQNKEEDYECSE